MTETDEILKALDVAIHFGWGEVDSVDRTGEQSSAGRCSALMVLEAHRVRLERERAFVEAAMALLAWECMLRDKGRGQSRDRIKLREEAMRQYRALVSEPGERKEGEK